MQNLKNYIATLINALKIWVNEKTKTASDDEILLMLISNDMLTAVHDADGALLSDENENVLLW